MEPRSALVLSHNYRDVGTYFRAQHVARHYAAQGWDVTFIHIGRENRFRPVERCDENLRIIEAPNYTHLFNQQEGWSAFDWWARLRVVTSKRFDRVFCFGHKPDILLPARHCQNWQASTVIADWCDMWGGQDGLIEQVIKQSADYRLSRFYQRWARLAGFAIEQGLEKRFCRKSHGAIVICDYLRCECMLQGMEEGQIQVMYSGCDTEKIRVEDRQACRREWGIEPKVEVLGYISNFQPDIPILLDALQRLAPERPNLRLLAAGAAFDGDIINQYAPEIVSRIRHIGFQPFERISSILGACDVLALPMADVTLNRARWPHKFTDYLASGRPIACCRVGDMADFVERDQTGMLSDSDGDSFGACIQSMLSAADRLQEWGRNSRGLAEGELSWSSQLKKLDAWLEELESRRSI